MALELYLAQLSRRQFGIVSKAQLLTLGFTEGRIRTWLRTGRLVWVLPGVLRVTSVPECWEQRPISATLWGGKITVASHLTGATVQGILDARTAPIEITTDHRLRARPGFVIRQRRLLQREITIVRSIPCTMVERTLADLCHAYDEDLAERALDTALRLGVTSLPALHDYVEEAASRSVRGSATLRRHLSVRGDDLALSESDLEDLFGRVVRRARMPMGQRQAPREGTRRGRVDIHYPEQNLVIELDGRKWHSARRELIRDRRYDNLLNISGKRVLRLNWEDLTLHEEYTVDIVARALGIQTLL